jgi:hypothetical protein
MLVAVPVGSLAAVVGSGPLAFAIGVLMALVGWTFVFGSVMASYHAFASRIRRPATPAEDHALGELAGPGLLRATFLGFIGAGLVVGVLSPLGLPAVIPAASGTVAFLLTMRPPLRRPR